MKTLFWRVLIQMERPELKTTGGIVLPDDVNDADDALRCVGKVVEIGPMAFTAKQASGIDYSLHQGDVKVGDWVLVNRKIGLPIKFKDGRAYQLVNDYEIMAVISEDEAAQIRAYI